MEWFLTQHAQGIPALAVRYDDLINHRVRVVTEIFNYCGLPSARVHETVGVFERDAQVATELARDNPHEGNRLRLRDEQRDEITTILQRHPVVKASDFMVPGTLQV